MPVQNLNDQFIKNLKPKDKRQEIYDENVKGLAIRVTPTGHKSFVYRYRYNDNVKRFTIGTYPDVSLAMARSDGKELSYKVSQGIDPNFEKKQRKVEPEKETTFKELTDRFEKRHLPTLREKTSEEYKRIIDRELLPKLGMFPAKEISRKQLIDLIDAIAFDRDSETLSNRVRAVLSSIFSFGVDKAIVEANPVLNIKRKKSETKRERVYTPDEIKALWEAFEEQEEVVESVYKMLLILGQRSGETRRMKWNDIDFEKQIWTIPKEETKANRTHVVPLTEMALDILDALKPKTGKSDFVFNSPKKENEPIRWLHKATDRIQTESGVKDFRPHDLRRTMASYTAQLGTDRTVLGKLLNHKGLAGDNQVTAIYDRYDYLDEKRSALKKWCQAMEKYLKEAEQKIINLTA